LNPEKSRNRPTFDLWESQKADGIEELFEFSFDVFVWAFGSSGAAIEI